MSEVRPVWNDGVPLCSEECPSHDGKRCQLTGFRPARICEPATADLRALCIELRDALKSLPPRHPKGVNCMEPDCDWCHEQETVNAALSKCRAVLGDGGEGEHG